MSIQERFDQADPAVREEMVSALREAEAVLDQLSADDEAPQRFGFVVKCPHAMAVVSRVATGNVSLDGSEVAFAQALITDYATNVGQVMEFGEPLTGAGALETTLAEGVSWDDLLPLVRQGIEFLSADHAVLRKAS